MPARYVKWILVDRNLPDHVSEWLNMQSNKIEAVKYLIYKDIYRNGVRDIFYTEDKSYGTKKVGTLYGSKLNFHENGNFGPEKNQVSLEKGETPSDRIYSRTEKEDLKMLDERDNSETADFYSEN